MDIYLLEAVLNGILLGGVLALLALGLNLIFGVVDVVWIAYAELVMCGMYAIWWLYAFYGWPFFLAAPAAILFVALLGVLLHFLIIEPIISLASGENSLAMNVCGLASKWAVTNEPAPSGSTAKPLRYSQPQL